MIAASFASIIGNNCRKQTLLFCYDYFKWTYVAKVPHIQVFRIRPAIWVGRRARRPRRSNGAAGSHHAACNQQILLILLQNPDYNKKEDHMCRICVNHTTCS